MTSDPQDYLEDRFHQETARALDVRTPYEKDRARIIHSAGFRRLQGKTQVMGIGEGDFHRTRLTHSIECAQVGTGILEQILRQGVTEEQEAWLPSRALVEASCFAHDLGHPPFGHVGEQSLFQEMRTQGGFEGNAQTLRQISKLEKHSAPGRGINPTRRFALSVLKYPCAYSGFNVEATGAHREKPPKCFYDEESAVVDWAFSAFSSDDAKWLGRVDTKGKPVNRTLDCSLMELGDDVAYGVHDIEDIVARKLASKDGVHQALRQAFSSIGGKLGTAGGVLDADVVHRGLFKDSFSRKRMMGRLVNVFITTAKLTSTDAEHPLLRFKVTLPKNERDLLDSLRKMSFHLVIERPPVRQLERRGKRIVGELFKALSEDPIHLIPSWDDKYQGPDSVPRRVCDYVAGMTDSYAEKVYQRLFVPGYGSSSDEL